MDLIDLSQVTDKQSGFAGYLDQVRERFGFDHVAYLGANPVAGTMHGYVTYPEEWKQLYMKYAFHRIDPTLHIAQRSIAPVMWERLEQNTNFITVFTLAQDYGISAQGMTIPVRGPFGDTGLLSVTSGGSAEDWRQRIRASVGELQSMAVHMHDSVMQSDTFSGILRRTQLSSRETEILQWIASGKTQQDVADILGISHRTVEVHLRSAREKLYSLTTPQAVARAIAQHLIYPL